MTQIQQHITINPEIRFGKPCIKVTRIAVWDILGWLASDMSTEEILEDFQELTRESILAALAFAANREESTKILITGARSCFLITTSRIGWSKKFLAIFPTVCT